MANSHHPHDAEFVGCDEDDSSTLLCSIALLVKVRSNVELFRTVGI